MGATLCQPVLGARCVQSAQSSSLPEVRATLPEGDEQTEPKRKMKPLAQENTVHRGRTQVLPSFKSHTLHQGFSILALKDLWATLFFVMGVVLCTVGCLASSLASIAINASSNPMSHCPLHITCDIQIYLQILPNASQGQNYPCWKLLL